MEDSSSQSTVATEIDEFTDLEIYTIVSGLESRSINFLAVDFDQTLINRHTGGEYSGPVSELVSAVRPFFRVLIPQAISRGNLSLSDLLWTRL